MQTDDKKSHKKILEEQTKQVYDLYKAKSKSFRTLYIWLVGFALLFFVIILYPYVSMQARNHEIFLTKKKLVEDIAEVNKKIKPYKNIQAGIKRLNSEIKKGPDILRQYIDQLVSGSGTPQRQRADQIADMGPRPEHDSSIVPGIPRKPEEYKALFEETMKNKIMHLFSEYEGILKYEVVTPLEKLRGKLPASFNMKVFMENFEVLKSTFQDELKTNPRFWETFRGKVEFSEKLLNEVNSFWSQHGKPIDEEEKRLRKEVKPMEDSKKQLEDEEANLSNEKKKLVNRLDQIEFPIGKIPIGLNDAIAVFPLLLAIGFCICSSLLRESMRLRSTYHQYSKSQDPEQIILTDEQIALVAPLWIDPLKSERNQMVGIAILLVPFLLFAASCVLIVYNWAIPDISLTIGQLPKWLYGILYVLSLGAFLFGYWQLITELRKYSRG